MPNTYFQFKQFIIHQDKCAMKVTTDACLFGSFVASQLPDGAGIKILDIGTGTGLLTLMLAQKNHWARIDAIEIDEQAVEQATANIDKSPWKRNINMIHNDINNFSFAYKYDIIISNPPFYENELKGEDRKKNMAHHSEQLTLSRLLSVIKNNLSVTGKFFLLLPYKRFDETKLLLESADLFVHQLMVIKQSPAHHFFRFIIEGSLQHNPDEEIKIEEWAIRNDQQNYSPEFERLLKDYYLNL